MRFRYAIVAICAIALPAGWVSAQVVPAEHKVSMLGMTYSPSKVEARVGDTIKFVNDDGENHEVFVPTRGFSIDLGIQRPGDARELQLLRAGTFEVECVLHSDMKITVTAR